MNKLSSVQDVDRCVNEKQDSDSVGMRQTAPSHSTSTASKDIMLTLAGIRAAIVAELQRINQYVLWQDQSWCRNENERQMVEDNEAQDREKFADAVLARIRITQLTKSAEGGDSPNDTVAGSLPHQSESESSPSTSVSEAEDKNSGEGSKEHRAVPRTEFAIIPQLSADPPLLCPWCFNAPLVTEENGTDLSLVACDTSHCPMYGNSMLLEYWNERMARDMSDLQRQHEFDYGVALHEALANQRYEIEQLIEKECCKPHDMPIVNHKGTKLIKAVQQLEGRHNVES